MPEAGPLRLGTRGSALALAQAGLIAELLSSRSARTAELVPIKTPDDAPATDKSRFTGALEHALSDGRIDIAVHSAKDLPADLLDELAIAAVPQREAVEDAWIGGGASIASVEQIPENASVGTASLRRRSQLLALRPDLRVGDLHGNVDTRLARVASGDFDGVVVALAGLRRLGRQEEASFTIDPSLMTPAAGQGAIALQLRADDDAAVAAVAPLDHRDSHVELLCERAAVAALGADCHTPVGVRASASDDDLVAEAYVGLPDGSEWIRDRVSGPIASRAGGPEAEALGRELAARLESAGAGELLARAAAEGARDER